MLGVTGSARATTPPPDGPTVLPLEKYLGVVPSMQVRLGDRDVTFLLDTAGGLTVLTPQTARSIGCRPWGRLTGYRMRGDRVDMSRCDDVRLDTVAGGPVKLAETGVWDFSHVLPENAPPLAGSIALDAFAGQAITLDLEGGRLILETPRSLAVRIRHAHEVPMRLKREVDGAALVPLVGIDTPKGRLWMQLDCGSDGPVIVNRPVAAALGLDPDNKKLQDLSTTFGDTVDLQASARVDDLIVDGNIGAPVLKHWVITMDLMHGRLC